MSRDLERRNRALAELASIRIAQRGLWYLLQRLSLEAERYNKSVEAGEAFMKVSRAGGVIYRQAERAEGERRPAVPQIDSCSRAQPGRMGPR